MSSEKSFDDFTRDMEKVINEGKKKKEPNRNEGDETIDAVSDIFVGKGPVIFSYQGVAIVVVILWIILICITK